MLYRLPRVLEAAAAGATVYVAEGEKDVHALEACGAVATCNPMGAGKGKWRDEYTRSLRGAHVVVVADRDDEGRKHAEHIRASLARAGTPARGRAPGREDAADHLAAGHGLDDFVAAESSDAKPMRDAAELSNLTLPMELLEEAGISEDDLEGVGSVKDLMKLLGERQAVGRHFARAAGRAVGVVLFHDTDHTPYATFAVGSHTETWPLLTQPFKQYVRRLYYLEKQAAPSGHAVTDALGVLAAQATFEGQTTPVHYRVAGDEAAIYIDLGDPDWRAIQITRDGWAVLYHHPVRFWRTGGMAALQSRTRRRSASAASIRQRRRRRRLACDCSWDCSRRPDPASHTPS